MPPVLWPGKVYFRTSSAHILKKRGRMDAYYYYLYIFFKNMLFIIIIIVIILNLGSILKKV